MLTEIENKLNYIFKNKALLDLALTHSSYINKKSNLFNNERLEFLGDKILGMIIANYLYCHFSNYTEGDLSKAYSYLTSKDILIKIAQDLNICKYIKKRNNNETSILVDAIEAIIASIYIDSTNLDNCKNFILNNWIPHLNNYLNSNVYNDFNPKSCIQEWAQKNKLPIPIYLDIKKEGEEHQPKFYVKLQILGYEDTTGIGSNKQLAQKDAATNFIKKYNICKKI